jgi:hypothetical protein
LLRGPSAALPGHAAIGQQALNTTTLAAVTELAPMAATTHLLDVANAVGGFPPSAAALATTRELLIAIPRTDRGIRHADRTMLAGCRHSRVSAAPTKLAQQTLINVCIIHFLDIG